MGANEGFVILHLSDLHFGSKSRFQGRDRAELGRAFAEDVVSSRAGVDAFREAPVRLVVVSGDIAETGKPAEFALGLEFLKALLDGLQLPAERCVFVPGNHDISWGRCKVVDNDREDYGWDDAQYREKLNKAKYHFYHEFLRDFYGLPNADLTLLPQRTLLDPFHGTYLHDFPDMRLSVAALNTSERETHQEQGGFLSQAQADSLMQAWRKPPYPGWLKVVVVHHNPMATPPENREWSEEYFKNQIAERGLTLSAEALAHYTADMAGFKGQEFLRRIVRDTAAHLVLHGHHHTPTQSELWPAGPQGIAPLLSVGSLSLRADQMPEEMPLTCQLLLFRTAPEPRLVAQPLWYKPLSRAAFRLERGRFEPEAGADFNYDRPLHLPPGWEAVSSGTATALAPELVQFVAQYRQRFAHICDRYDLKNLGVFQEGGGKPIEAKLDRMYQPLRLGKSFDSGKTYAAPEIFGSVQTHTGQVWDRHVLVEYAQKRVRKVESAQSERGTQRFTDPSRPLTVAPPTRYVNPEKILTFLEALTPADLGRLIVRFDGASAYIPERANHLQQVTEFVAFVRSATGPGMERVAEQMVALFPKADVYASPGEVAPPERERTTPTFWEFTKQAIQSIWKESPHIAINGVAGAGKTTWMRATFNNLLAHSDGGAPQTLPILIELRAVADSWKDLRSDDPTRSIEAYLRGWLTSNGIDAADRLLTLMDDPLAPLPFLLVDGWDELGNFGTEFRGKLLGFLHDHLRVTAVVTSRPYGEGRPDFSDGFQQLHLQPLAPEEIRQMARRFLLLDNPDSVDEEVLRFDAALARAENATELAKNPLLLTMMLFIHRTDQLPDKRYKLYDKCLMGLLGARPDGRALAGISHMDPRWEPPKDSDLRRQIVAEFAYRLQSGEWSEGVTRRTHVPKSVFSDHNVVVDWEEAKALLVDSWSDHERGQFLHWLCGPVGLLTDRTDGTVTFAHLSFQEFLTAWHLNAKHVGDAAGPIFAKWAQNPSFWEIIQLWAALVDAQSPERADKLIAPLIRNAQTRPLVGMMLADGLGTEEVFTSWVSLFLQDVADIDRHDGTKRCFAAWRASRQENRRTALIRALHETANCSHWQESLRIEWFLKGIGDSLKEKLDAEDFRHLSAAWLRHYLPAEQKLTAPAIATSRLADGQAAISEKLTLSWLNLWPSKRRLLGARLQRLACLDGSKNQGREVVRAAFEHPFDIQSPMLALALARASNQARNLATLLTHIHLYIRSAIDDQDLHRISAGNQAPTSVIDLVSVLGLSRDLDVVETDPDLAIQLAGNLFSAYDEVYGARGTTLLAQASASTSDLALVLTRDLYLNRTRDRFHEFNNALENERLGRYIFTTANELSREHVGELALILARELDSNLYSARDLARKFSIRELVHPRESMDLPQIPQHDRPVFIRPHASPVTLWKFSWILYGILADIHTAVKILWQGDTFSSGWTLLHFHGIPPVATRHASDSNTLWWKQFWFLEEMSPTRAYTTSDALTLLAINARGGGGDAQNDLLVAASRLSIAPDEPMLQEDFKRSYSQAVQAGLPAYQLALARHLGGLSTEADRALLEDLAAHPEQCSDDKLRWGLQYIVRGDVLFKDGSTVTLDEWCAEIGQPPLPYLEPPIRHGDYVEKGADRRA